MVQVQEGGMPENLLTVDAIASRLGVHVVTVRRWIRSGQLRPAVGAAGGRGYRVAEAEVARFMRATTERDPERVAQPA